jgi:hypothetical protein
MPRSSASNPPAGQSIIARRVGAAFILAFPILYGALSLWVGQDANWDLENYHWYNAYAFLTGREARDVLVSQTPSFYNPLLDVPFYLAATHLPARLVGFALGWIQGLNGVLLFLLAHRALPRPGMERVMLAMLAAVVGMLGGATLGEIGTTFGDNIVSLGLFGGLLILLGYATRPARPAIWAVAAGLLLGAAAGLKQPHLVYCLGIGVGVLFLPGSWPRRIGLAGCVAAGGIGGIALTGGFWMAHLWHAYGDPLFPYYNQLFQSPFAAVNRDYRDTVMIPKEAWVRAFYPFYFTIDPYRAGEVAQRGPAILALFVLLPLGVLSALWRRAATEHRRKLADPAASRFLLAAMAFSYLAWLQMFCIYRYLAPLEMLAPLGVLLAMDCLPGAFGVKRVVAAALLALCAATGVRGDWGRVAWGDRYVEIHPPALAPDTLALMAGYEPVGFIAAGLPPEIPVLRIQSNFTHLGDTPTRFTAIMKDRIAAHDGPMVIIYLRKDQPNVDQALADYALTEDRASCRDVPNSLDDRGVMLCDVARRRD